MAKPKVFVHMPVDESGASHKQFTDAGCEIVLGEDSWRTTLEATPEEVFRRAQGSDALIGAIIRGIEFDRKFLNKLPNLRIIAKYTIGYDEVDVATATAQGILVTHSPTEANWGGVAEGTIALILSILKKVRERDRQMKNGGWRDPSLLATYLGARQDGYDGLTIGILGLGRIGSRVADLFGPWRVKLIGCDPYVDESVFAHHNVRPVDFETLLRESDVLTIHCNLTAETEKLIDEARLSLMKPSAVLINAARGEIVDGDALFDALDRDRLAGAALDVFEVEPLPTQSPLLGLGDKVLLSPHMISQSHGGGLQPAIPWATKAVMDALRGEVPRHVVNPDAIPLWRERFGGKSLI